MVRSQALAKKTLGDLTGSAVQVARGPPGIAPGIAAGIVHGKWSVQIAQGAPGIAPGIARHCPRQVVLAAWIYDMMCVCCVSLSLSRSMSSPCGALSSASRKNIW